MHLYKIIPLKSFLHDRNTACRSHRHYLIFWSAYATEFCMDYIFCCLPLLLVVSSCLTLYHPPPQLFHSIQKWTLYHLNAIMPASLVLDKDWAPTEMAGRGICSFSCVMFRVYIVTCTESKTTRWAMRIHVECNLSTFKGIQSQIDTREPNGKRMKKSILQSIRRDGISAKYTLSHSNSSQIMNQAQRYFVRRAKYIAWLNSFCCC